MRGYPAPCLLVFCVKGMHNLAGFLLPGKNCRQIMGKSAHRPFKKCSYVRALCGSHMAQKNDAQKRNFDLWDVSEHNSPNLLSSSLLKNFTTYLLLGTLVSTLLILSGSIGSILEGGLVKIGHSYLNEILSFESHYSRYRRLTEFGQG